MKTLLNCSPKEFLTQAARIREPFMKWLEVTGIPEIRARLPEGYEAMDASRKREAIAEQGNINMADMLAACIEKDPEGSLMIMGLFCFTEPEEIDKHPMSEYLAEVLKMIANDAVRSFFMLYLKPSQMNISKG